MSVYTIHTWFGSIMLLNFDSADIFELGRALQTAEELIFPAPVINYERFGAQ